MGVLAFKMVLKICYRFFFKYLTIKEAVKSSKAGLRVRSKVRLGSDDSSNLSISLITRERALNIVYKGVQRAIKA